MARLICAPPDDLIDLAAAILEYEPETRIRRWDLREFCGGHRPQLRAAESRARKKRIQSARQAGKTTLCDGIMNDRGLLWPESIQLYIGLNGVAVRQNNWIPVWKRRILDAHGIVRKDNDQQMVTYYPNGTRAIFMGSDDLRHLKNLLGNRLPAGSTVIVDEGQDQKDEFLAYIFDQVLPPMTTPDTLIMIAGVKPDVPAGLFYEWRNDPSWEQHGWGRFDNVHTPEASEQLRLHLQDNGITFEDLGIDLANPPKDVSDLGIDLEHPPDHVKAKLGIVFQVLRDWFNLDVYDPSARTYFYVAQTNGYTPTAPAWAAGFSPPHGFGRVMFAEPWPGIDTFAVAIDPGGDDPFGLQVIGWGKTHRRIQHLVDWVSPRDARLTWGQVMEALGKVVAQRYPTRFWCYDTTSDTELDTFGHQYGVPVIRAAKKADRDGQIRRMNDLLRPGNFAVMDGSNLAYDLVTAKLVKGEWVGHHPTASECARYGLRFYWEKAPKAPPPKTAPAEDPFDKEMRMRREAEAKLTRNRRR